MTKKELKQEQVVRVLDYTHNPIELLSLMELKQTASERTTGGKPLHGVEHWELLDMICDKISKHTNNFELGTIATSDGGNKSVPGVTFLPYMEADFGKNALQASLLRRMITSITLKDHANKKDNGMIVIAFHQLGIQVAHAMNVKFCNNMNIFTRENLMSTYGEGNWNKIASIPKMVEVIGDWVHSQEERLETMRRISHGMSEIPMGNKEVHELIGDLNVMRVEKDIFRSVKDYALNQAQISKFTEDYIRKTSSNPESIQTLWDVYNLATEMHKPFKTDIPLILPNNIALGSFIINKFNLNN